MNIGRRLIIFILYAIGSIFYWFHRYYRGIKYFKKALEFGRGDLRFGIHNYYVGLGYYKLRRFADAITYFEEYMKKKKGAKNALLRAAVCYDNLAVKLPLDSTDRKKLLERARALVNEVVLFNSENALLYAILGTIEKHRGELVSAKAHFLKALALDPNCKVAKEHMCDLL